MPARDENVILSARNLRHIEIGHVDSINVVELLKHEHLIMPVASVDRIVEMFGEEADDRLGAQAPPRPDLPQARPPRRQGRGIHGHHGKPARPPKRSQGDPRQGEDHDGSRPHGNGRATPQPPRPRAAVRGARTGRNNHGNHRSPAPRPDHREERGTADDEARSAASATARSCRATPSRLSCGPTNIRSGRRSRRCSPASRSCASTRSACRQSPLAAHPQGPVQPRGAPLEESHRHAGRRPDHRRVAGLGR